MQPSKRIGVPEIQSFALTTLYQPRYSFASFSRDIVLLVAKNLYLHDLLHFSKVCKLFQKIFWKGMNDEVKCLITKKAYLLGKLSLIQSHLEVCAVSVNLDCTGNETTATKLEIIVQKFPKVEGLKVEIPQSISERSKLFRCLKEKFSHVKSLTFEKTEPFVPRETSFDSYAMLSEEEVIQIMNDHTKLSSLTLKHCSISHDPSTTYLEKLTSLLELSTFDELTTLNLTNSRCDDQTFCLFMLSFPSMTSLILQGFDYSDFKDFEQLALSLILNNLTFLDVSKSSITSDQLFNLISRCPKLTNRNICRTSCQNLCEVNDDEIQLMLDSTQTLAS